MNLSAQVDSQVACCHLAQDCTKTRVQQAVVRTSVGVGNHSDSIHFCHHYNSSDFQSLCPGTLRSPWHQFLVANCFMAFPGTPVGHLFDRSAMQNQPLMPPPGMGLRHQGGGGVSREGGWGRRPGRVELGNLGGGG